MAPFSPQSVTPQKRHLEKSLEKAGSILQSGGLNKGSFYGSSKRPRVFAKPRTLKDMWSDNAEKKTDVYEFDENGETTCESPFSRIVKPHEIGFPNPPGTNICWMNATLQLILGMRPLIDELEAPTCCGGLSRNRYSPTLRAFLDVMRHHRRGRLLPVHRDLNNLKAALATLDSGFACEHQQDAPEFLIRLLDNFREDFYELCKSEKKGLFENSALKELQNDNSSSTSPGTHSPSHREVSNPICDNLQFSMKERYCCTSCGESSDRSQEHLALYVDVPLQQEGESDVLASVDAALDQYMRTHTRELRCERCGGEHCRVDTTFSRLPRILLIQVKRYTCLDNLTQKITSSVGIPLHLDVGRVVDPDVVMPRAWTPVPEKENKWLNGRSVVISTQEEMYEEETDEESEEAFKYTYKLTGILSHHGDNPNTGHYVADVYHHGPDSWYHYDDEYVDKVYAGEVLGMTREESGYMFVYTYRPLHNQLKHF